ncbi:helix-turn-helix domain-containing protein [Flavobacterium suncheonense]|uniref:Transcriptional regulator n=1 Tax=Flavobacterium suncheonense GH29-5 = DSM 17707 TaxID=1121899 RepID=A0A0A2M6H7_9FLAO|nr:helix-turn-helix transcriptional regulator [Flavobacterium suncheonense]KGO87889.1 transcriptional regulator [Flavobacterium suncheonense GH29-5 = DSM 17707]
MSTVAKNHIGRKISRIRELRDMKQEALAAALGVSQQTISNIENSETVEEEKLQEIAKVLGVTAEGIRNFSEEAVFNIISNTYHNTSSDNSTLIASSLNYQPTFNTVDKMIELYERLLQAEKDKVAYLERLTKEK